jgi:hypothetical protein
VKSIDQQIQALGDQWPGFRLRESTSRSATWEGVLAPVEREHTVRVRYSVPYAIENVTSRDIQPRVQVISPRLERHNDYEEGPIPHVYVCDSDAGLPYLCLFSPSAGEWSADDLIAHTTIFWAAQWLYFYEFWLLTKRWKGGGRHLPRAERDKHLEPEKV